MSLQSNNNVILVDNCKNLKNLTVTLRVTQDLVTLGNTGFSLQLNTYPQQGSTCQGKPLNWFQYVIYIANNQPSHVNQYWSLGSQAYSSTEWWPPGYTPNPPNTSPWLPVLPHDPTAYPFGSAPLNQVPAGSVIEIKLATDANGNVASAMYSMTDPHGKVYSDTFAFSKEALSLYPISGFQVNLVGPGNDSSCTFASGAGTLTYSVSPGSLSIQEGGVGAACGQYSGAVTGEESNIVYGDPTPVSGATISQSLGGVYTLDLRNKAVLGDTSSDSPTLTSQNGMLFLGWKGDGNNNLNVMLSSNNGGGFGNKFTSSESSDKAPALAAHNGRLFIAWKGSGNANMNVAQVPLIQTNFGNYNIQQFANKTVLGDTTNHAPALASHNGLLFIAWKGNGNDNLNVAVSADNGHTWMGKLTSVETSTEGPALVSHNGKLFIAWKGSGNDSLNVAWIPYAQQGNQWVIQQFQQKLILNDSSPAAPALASSPASCSFPGAERETIT